MIDLKRDTLTGGLARSVNGDFVLTTDKEDLTAQWTMQALGLNLGEWFVNILQGLPYLRPVDEPELDSIKFFFDSGMKVDITFIKEYINSYIKSLDFVDDVSTTYIYSASNRVLELTITIRVGDEDFTLPNTSISL